MILAGLLTRYTFCHLFGEEKSPYIWLIDAFLLGVDLTIGCECQYQACLAWVKGQMANEYSVPRKPLLKDRKCDSWLASTYYNVLLWQWQSYFYIWLHYKPLIVPVCAPCFVPQAQCKGYNQSSLCSVRLHYPQTPVVVDVCYLIGLTQQAQLVMAWFRLPCKCFV